MAERKSGPVKPPVIDLKAREATSTPPVAEGLFPDEPPAAPDPATAPEAAPSEPARRRARRPAAAATPPPEAAETKAAETDAAETGAARASAEASADAAPPSPPPTVPTPPGDDKPASPPAADKAAADLPPTPAEAPEVPSAAANEPSDAPRAADESGETANGPAAGQPQPARFPPPPPPPRPPARLAMPWSAISIAALGGAVLGAVLTYLAANWIALPQPQPGFDDPAPALAELTAGSAALEARLTALEADAAESGADFDAATARLDAGLAELRDELAATRLAIPPAQTVDLSPIEAELQRLESRVAALGAGASSEDAAALARGLDALGTTLESFEGRVAELEARTAVDDERLADLAAGIETARAAIAAQTRTLAGAEIGPAVKLPLLVSGLESAVSAGRPYATELDALTALLPELDVPETVAAQAESGLPRPDAVVARFNAALPAIIAGRTRESTGDWASDALEWTRALLALRPATELEGDTPEAVISRLEGAMGRRDFVAAATLLGQLPAPMREAAGSVADDIHAHAGAETFIARLRAEALAPATEPAS